MVKFEDYATVSHVGDLPVLTLPPFNVATYEQAEREGDESVMRDAAHQFVTSCANLSFGALYDGGRYIKESDWDDTFRFLDLFFRINPALLRQYPGDKRTIGYLGPGDEKIGKPEVWKSSWYCTFEGEGKDRGFRSGYFPQGENLLVMQGQRQVKFTDGGIPFLHFEGEPTPMTSEQREFYNYGVNELLPHIHQQRTRMATFPVKVLLKYCLGMEPTTVDSIISQLLVDDGTENGELPAVSRGVIYHTGPSAKIADTFTNWHADSGLGAAVSARLLTDRTFPDAKPGLRVRTPQGDVGVKLSSECYSWNTGYSLMALMGALEREGLANLERVPPGYRVKNLTKHAVFREKENIERAAFVTFPQGNQHMKIGGTTLGQIREAHISQFVGN